MEAEGNGYIEKRNGPAIAKPAQTSKQTIMEEQTNALAEQITANIISTTKTVLTADETAKYLGLSKSYLYKLTMKKLIPHYKPLGKMCYFNREEVENWVQRQRIATDEELNQMAAAYCRKGGRK